MAELNYVVFEGYPAIHDDREAWALYDEEAGWRKVPLGEVLYNGGILTKEKFRSLIEAMFPDAPELPADAFRPSAGSARTRPGPGSANRASDRRRP